VSIPKRPQTDIRVFLGVNFDADPQDFPSGMAQEQVNLIPRAATLVVRKGMATLRFDEEVEVDE
jgi:hypothetical protein